MAKRNKFKFFLDIDGVLNSGVWFNKVAAGRAGKSVRLKQAEFRTDRFFPMLPHYRLDPEAIKCANVLIKEIPNSEWVVSSSWRHGTPDMFHDLVLYLEKCGLEGQIIGRTGTTVSASRGNQIQMYLDDNGLKAESCLILDDDSDMLHLSPRHIKTNYTFGLTPDDVKRALQLVGR